jgi:hypothetical protein
MKLLRVLLQSLKWWIAQEEMETLYHYRKAVHDAKQHLSQFPDAAQALDYVGVMAERHPLDMPIDIRQLKKRMEDQRVDLLKAIHTLRTTA